jgi:SAM-dependent methyltransferase
MRITHTTFGQLVFGILVVIALLRFLKRIFINDSVTERQPKSILQSNRNTSLLHLLRDLHRVSPLAIKLSFNVNDTPPRPMKALREEGELPKRRGFYGGGSDPNHIGGFLHNDSASYEPLLWLFMIDILRIKSVLDVGCGIGVSSNWFRRYGRLNQNQVLCIEGSADAVNHSLVRDITVEHDYTRGSWWPSLQYDAAWAVEFLGDFFFV